MRVRSPQSGERLSADWGRHVARELNASRLSVCPPLMLTRTPTGTTLRVRSHAPAAAKIESCWNIAKLTLDTIELEHCHFMRGPITVLHEGEVSTSLSGIGEKIVVALINLKDHSITLFAGDADILLQTTPAEQSEMYTLPLYMLDRTSADSLWQVVCDMRSIPQLGVMI